MKLHMGFATVYMGLATGLFLYMGLATVFFSYKRLATGQFLHRTPQRLFSTHGPCNCPYFIHRTCCGLFSTQWALLLSFFRTQDSLPALFLYMGLNLSYIAFIYIQALPLAFFHKLDLLLALFIHRPGLFFPCQLDIISKLMDEQQKGPYYSSAQVNIWSPIWNHCSKILDPKQQPGFHLHISLPTLSCLLLRDLCSGEYTKKETRGTVQEEFFIIRVFILEGF